MNPIITDDKHSKSPYSYKNNKEQEITRKEIENSFEYNLYQDVGDVYSRNNNRRQFYTVPSATIEAGDNSNFKNYLFGNMKSGKENTYAMGRSLNEPLQNNRRIN
jgi:hypothetical protein